MHHRLRVRRALRRPVVLGVLVGATLGGSTAAYGAFSHTYALWVHGVDGSHVWMSSTDGAGRLGSVAPIICLTNPPAHGENSEYIGSHVHVDGGLYGCAGHIYSTQTGLSHHQHDNNG